MDTKKPIENLTISCANGVYNTTWERDGRQFDFGVLYGYSSNRSYTQMKAIMEEEQGVILPSEIAVKTLYENPKAHKKVCHVPDELIQYKKEHTHYSDVKFGEKGTNFTL